jgi:hypothetical protein
VAELRRPSSERLVGPVEQALERLHAEGVLVPGFPQRPEVYRRTRMRLAKGSSRELLDAERGER